MTCEEFDFSAHYTAGAVAVAWRAIGYATEWTEEEYVYSGEGDPDDELSYFFNESEEVEDWSRVRMVMVGDDRVFEFDVVDVEKIPEDSFCRDCGQIGCGCNVYV